MTKPNPAAVRASVPLSIVPLSSDRLACCNVCGKPAEQLEVWRAHDEQDRPIADTRALVFLGAGESHESCHRKLEAHARLFAPELGKPGHLPLVCPPCAHRRGVDCTSPDLEANGGEGLQLRISAPAGVICFGRGRGGCQSFPRGVVACSARTLRSEAAE